MSAEGRPPRRMLPSVTDVVNQLSRVVEADPAVLFKVSRQVVAEELGRVKQGFESASIEVLARRARRLLDPAAREAPSPPPVQSKLFAVPESVPAPPAPPESPSEPAAPEPTAAAASSLSPDEPFRAPSEVELGWEKELLIQSDDAPFRPATPPSGITPPEAPEPSALAPNAPAQSAAALPSPPAAEEAPEAEEVEVVEEAPVLAETALQTSAKPVSPDPVTVTPPASDAPVPVSAAFLRDAAPAAPPALPLLDAGNRAAPPWSDTRPAFEPPPADERQPIRLPEDAALRGVGPEPPTTHDRKVPGEIGVASERLPGRMPEPASAPEPEPAGVPPKPGKRVVSGWLIAVAAVVVVAAGLAYFLKDLLFVRPVTRPEVNVAAEPARPEPTPVPATPAAAPSAPVPSKHVAPSSPGKTKGALVVSREWAGRPAIWVVHFTSHKDRAGAEKEAARLAAALGKSGHAIEVDLGEKGTWYRVLIGDFATQEEARAYRSELEARSTPNLGLVYHLKGEE